MSANQSPAIFVDKSAPKNKPGKYIEYYLPVEFRQKPLSCSEPVRGQGGFICWSISLKNKKLRKGLASSNSYERLQKISSKWFVQSEARVDIFVHTNLVEVFSLQEVLSKFHLRDAEEIYQPKTRIPSKNANLVAVVQHLLPVKFCQNLFSSIQGQDKIVRR